MQRKEPLVALANPTRSNLLIPKKLLCQREIHGPDLLNQRPQINHTQDQFNFVSNFDFGRKKKTRIRQKKAQNLSGLH